jgi:hypothetical protein
LSDQKKYTQSCDVLDIYCIYAVGLAIQRTVLNNRLKVTYDVIAKELGFAIHQLGGLEDVFMQCGRLPESYLSEELVP